MVIFQKPNLLLIIAIFGFVINKITTGPISILANTIFTMAISIWAHEEVTRGVNLFRKLLGAAVLVSVAVSLFNQLK